jgi:hypothetical protein
MYGNIQSKWFDELRLPENELKAPRSLVIPNTFQLTVLQHEFQTLLTSFTDVECSKCHTKPKMPALCLICGTLICVNSKCCAEGPVAIPESIQVSTCLYCLFLIAFST